jgi:arylformamidase
MGPCRVVTVKAARGTRIGPDEVEIPPSTQRVLFHTGTFPDPVGFNEDFAALSPDLVEMLGRSGVRLIGIDTPSVDLFDTTDLTSHKMLLKYDMANLERIVLAGVPDGEYELIALPLKLVGFDASPVRAVLRTLD